MLAVLVSATPCPLILAVPVAIISGISKAARRGVLVKGGPVLETLARASVLVIDKTGTLTEGRARLVNVHALGRRKPDEIFRLAASLDQASQHVIAASVVEAATGRGLALSMPVHAKETAGSGIEGHVDGKQVIVGGSDFVRRKLKLRTLQKPAAPPGSVIVAVAVDGHLAGHLILADGLRHDAAHALAYLRKAGFTRIVLASGDQQAVVEAIASQLDIDHIRSELLPREKVDVVIAERANGVVLMAGDGVNDAPALAAADVGISMGYAAHRLPPSLPMQSCSLTIWYGSPRRWKLPSVPGRSRCRASMWDWRCRWERWWLPPLVTLRLSKAPCFRR